MNNKLFASVSGVCITSAVVVGAVLAAANHDDQPRQQPAGDQVAVVTAPATVTVSATVTASPTPTVVAKVSPSTKPAAAPKKRAAVVQNQGDPVTDPQPPAAPQTSTEPPQPAPIDNGTGSVDEGGVRRAPAPTDKVREPSPVDPPPLGPGAHGTH
jgi:hypothetical protein